MLHILVGSRRCNHRAWLFLVEVKWDDVELNAFKLQGMIDTLVYQKMIVMHACNLDFSLHFYSKLAITIRIMCAILNVGLHSG